MEYAKQSVFIPITQLKPFRNHPFKPYEGERLEDMAESVKQNGVLVPIIVQPLSENFFEILSGHNRVNASRQAGKEDIPAIVLEGLTEEEAWIYVVETNLIQRSFSEMLHSEKATILSVQYSKMFSQGKRNDILKELNEISSTQNYNKNITCAHVGHKLSSRDRLGETYSLSKNTVARYLRINKLCEPLKNMLDIGNISFIPAVALSFLSEKEQYMVHKSIALNQFKLDIDKAEFLRIYSKKNKLDEDNIYLILNGELGKNSPSPVPAFKISNRIYKKYFTDSQETREVEDIIDKALNYYFLEKVKNPPKQRKNPENYTKDRR